MAIVSQPEQGSGGTDPIVIRSARPADVRAMVGIVEPYARRRILIAKEMVTYYESIQEFMVAEVYDGGAAPFVGSQSPRIIGCGALHVLWDDIAEIRTLAVVPEYMRQGVGKRLVEALIARARDLGLARVFCLTFEVDFFKRRGFHEIDGTPVTPEVYAELLRSQDDGVAEFLDLARVKPNTLGNSRVLLTL